MQRYKKTHIHTLLPIGQIVRFCQWNLQWSNANYTNCQCPSIVNSTGRHIQAHHYVFECNFWLINRLLPEENSCIFVCIIFFFLLYSRDDSFSFFLKETDDNSLTTCLLSAFEKMSNQFCQSFRIDFQNIQLEIYLPKSNENLHQLSINDLRLTKTNSSPLMIINENQNSFLLIEQSNKSYARQTAANLTVTFNHQVRSETKIIIK
mgnify:FL=1